MFLHPKYKFCPSNGPIVTAPVDEQFWWKDVFNAQHVPLSSIISSVPPQNPADIPVDMNSTMKAIRQFIKTQKLGIKSTGKGRNKKNVLKDIQHLMRGRNLSIEDAIESKEEIEFKEELESKDDDASNVPADPPQNVQIFPVPFGGFHQSFQSEKLANAEIDESKFEFRWIPGQNPKAEIAAISLLLCWSRRWLFEGQDIEHQFFESYKCTARKFKEGMFGQKCAGCIVAVYEEMIIGCLMVHRFPLFVNSDQVENHSMQNTILDVTMEEMVSALHDLNPENTDILKIRRKNSYLLIESVTIVPYFATYYQLIGYGMFKLLFGSYPNDLFVAPVLFGNVRMWSDLGFIPFKGQVVVRQRADDEHHTSQVHRMMKVTSNRNCG